MTDQKEEIYVSLGKLYYSIAASDGHVAPEEIKKMKKLVSSRWAPLETAQDSVGTGLARYIEIGFDHAHDNKTKAAQAWEQFEKGFKRYPEEFDASTRNLVVRTAKEVADAQHGTNPSEEKMLQQLERLMNS